MQAECVVEVKSFAGIEPAALAPVINAIISDPYIAQRVAHDHRAPGFIGHPDVTYYGAFVNGSLVGAFCVIASGFVEVDIHAYLTKRAHRWCRLLSRAFLNLVFTDRVINRVTAYVLEGLHSARNHCLKLGFVDEGFRRGAYMRGGQLIGVHVLGLTRDDWVMQ